MKERREWVSTPEVAMLSNESMVDQHVYDSVSLHDVDVEVPPTVDVAVEIHQEEEEGLPSLPPPRKPARMKRREKLTDNKSPALKETLV